jgi:ABC-2 type transport system ATP-binding protein
MSILTVSNLVKRFGPTSNEFTAVDDISFDLKEGEILGLLGPNGAGKTTTIQMLLGVLTPTHGTISYFDKDFISNREEILENVNFSSTYTEFPWLLTVKENLTFISYLYSIKDRQARIEHIVDIFNLKHLLNIQIQDLSAGQKTRVNLAKAFINFPKILLLDEPTASLDPEAAKYIRKFLLSERKKFQVSIILTSHNMAEVDEVCDRVIFIDKGKIIADDTPEKLAGSIEISHVELLINDGLKRAIEFCNQNNFVYKVEGRYIIVDVKEREISAFLEGLMKKGTKYDEISIEKPTLEDYFLQVIGKKPHSINEIT